MLTADLGWEPVPDPSTWQMELFSFRKGPKEAAALTPISQMGKLRGCGSSAKGVQLAEKTVHAFSRLANK